ncbi:hypothetical protein QRD89_15935 [Halobacillus sp. ACCC02827]|uniref:hypothetical protein n=1 Tax=unclassified Halobacillus TaxID=2636472 RepID=UPI000783F0BE|nr:MULTISPECIES: hypothetical protein [unclassified Halobacillus]WJE15193.1 hypothetical protein QRD89_15935 [Halobacillus sp. ACCC02827]
MRAKLVKSSIAAGFLTFVLCLVIFFAADSPSPYIGALVTGFLIFEIVFYHFFGRDREKQRLR